MNLSGKDERSAKAATPPFPPRPGPPIHRMFEERVRRNPDGIAVTCEEENLSYNELNRRANRLARHLRDHYRSRTGVDIGPDTLIAIFLGRGVDMVVAVLAVLKAGAAYVPIDPGLPPDRIRYLVADTRCRIVLTHQDRLDRFQESVSAASSAEPGVHPVVLDLDLGRGEDEADLAVPVADTDLAYVIYTSGTTGFPKGVMIEHRSVVNLARSRVVDFAITEGCAVLQLSSLAFDASVCEIFSALILGARLIIATEDVRLDPDRLLGLLRSESVTVATILPSLLARLSLSGVPDLPALATLVVAGEPCTGELMRSWSVGRRLINAYGPTETTVCATVHRYRPGDPPATIGRAIANLRVYALDERLEPVRPGAVGEVCVAGVGVARGYLNRADLTAERFVPNPVGADSAYGVLYRTGDLARRSADGTLEYVGRDDLQVKIRGHRVELGEIEHHLLAYPSVRQVCVAAMDTYPASADRGGASPRERVLVGYYVADQDIDPRQLIRYLRRSLPDHLVPRRYLRLAEFPVTANGKIDRGQLPTTTAYQLAERVPPRTERERTLLDIWRAVLGIAVGIEDDFFEIGGDSLLAATLADELGKRFDRTVYTSMVHGYRTVAAQAALLDRVAPSGLPRRICEFRAEGTRPPLFFVHPSMAGAELYRRMLPWLDPDQPFYGIESFNRDHLSTPETDLRSLARRYVGDVRDIRPTGPYLLGGYSAGGNIAYEMAHQLRAAGETVAGLYLIDSVALPAGPGRQRGPRARDAEDFLDYFGLGSRADTNLLRLAEAEMSLLFGYAPPGKLDVGVVLIRAEQPLAPLADLHGDHVAHWLLRRDSRYAGWEDLAPDIDCHTLAANHTTIMVGEHLARVTRIVQAHINMATTAVNAGTTTEMTVGTTTECGDGERQHE